MAVEEWIIGGVGLLGVLEAATYMTVQYVRSKFPWFITKKDEVPPFDWKKINEIDFFESKHDPELGWVPHPNKKGREKTRYFEEGKWKHYTTEWTTNNEGVRSNPGHEDLDKKVIACFGDSFTFSRQVNDDETWPWHLSKQLQVNAINYGMGNYGLDQALLRLEKELQKGLRVKTVIMGVVPDTISRIVSVWKHYYEYGNTLNFKPRFVYDEGTGELILIPNRVNSEEKFKGLERGEHLDHLRENDYFYAKKFKKDMVGFPYGISLLKNPSRNLRIICKTLALSMAELGVSQEEKTDKFYSPAMEVIRRINLGWTARLYQEREPVQILDKLLDRYVELSKQYDFTPVFAFLPQKNEFAYETGFEPFYLPFLNESQQREGLVTIDVTEGLKAYQDQTGSVSDLYSERSDYGAHYNARGNQIIAEIIHQGLKAHQLLKETQTKS